MHIDQRMEDFVIALLKEKIPADHYYHNYEHALYVQEKALEIAQHESCNEADMRLLNAAALWHDAGHIVVYDGHEHESCVLVKKELPAFGYSAADIAAICGMIMATKVPQSPVNKLEQILADADMEYCGAPGAAEKATLLFNELRSMTPSLTKAAWDKKQIIFLQSHHYFTRYCVENKEPVKRAYLQELIIADQ